MVLSLKFLLPMRACKGLARAHRKDLRLPDSVESPYTVVMNTQTNAAHFIDRVLDPLAETLNPEAAESILNLRIDPKIQARVAVLAERANEAELTPEERDEYLSYAEAADLLAIFKQKAEHRLSRTDSGRARPNFGARSASE